MTIDPLWLPSRLDEIMLTINGLIDRDGLTAVTMRAIAREMRFSVGTLTGHVTSRERMLLLCGRRFGELRLDWLRRELPVQGIAAALPGRREDLWHTRAWLAWHELARSNGQLADRIARTDLVERYLLALSVVGDTSAIDRCNVRSNAPMGYGVASSEGAARWDSAALDSLVAAVQGLRGAVSAHGEHAMPLDRAQEALAKTVAALAADQSAG